MTETMTPAQAPAPSTRRQVLVDWARRGLIILVLVAAVWAVVSQWSEVSSTLHTIPVWSLAGAFVATVGGVLLGMLAWRSVLVGIAHPGTTRVAPVYLVGQMGKYLPGSVWAFVLQMEMGRKAGLARAQVFVAAVVSTGVSVAASLAVGLLAIPQLKADYPYLQWGYAALPLMILALTPKFVTWAVNLVLKILRKAPLSAPLTARSIFLAFGYALLMYGAFGVQIWLLVRSRGGIGLENAAFLTGALALSMTVGVVAFLMPSGLGAREAVLVVALGMIMPVGVATAFALVSRIVFTIAELFAMAVGLAPEAGTLRRALRTRHTSSTDPDPY